MSNGQLVTNMNETNARRMSYHLVQGDCLEVMPTLPPQSIDMICADTPYGTTAGQVHRPGRLAIVCMKGNGMSNEQAQQVIADLRDITMRQAAQTIEQANQIADLHRQLQEHIATIAELNAALDRHAERSNRVDAAMLRKDATITRLQRRIVYLETTVKNHVEEMLDYTEGMLA
jgi:ABC-type transporter Mla subunit MlaD